MSIQPIICCMCGKPITSFHQDQENARYENKWRIHWACKLLVEQKLDEHTGIASERRKLWKTKK